MKTVHLKECCLALVLEDPHDAKQLLTDPNRIESLACITEAYVLGRLNRHYSEPDVIDIDWSW